MNQKEHAQPVATAQGSVGETRMASAVRRQRLSLRAMASLRDYARRVRRAFAQSVRAIVPLVPLALAACANTPLGEAPGPRTATITVIDRGWHTELGLPVRELAAPLSSLAARFPGARVLTFGFGDRAFVLNRNSRVAEALGALFPSPGLVLVTALNTSAENAFGTKDVVRLTISRAALALINGFVWQSLAKKNAGGADNLPPEPYAPGPYPGTLYYASSVTYDAFNTCNTWVTTALRAGGVPVPSGVLFASQVMGEVRRLAAQQGAGRPSEQTAGGAGETTVVPAGETTVVPARGGGGLLLLKEMHPPSNSGTRRAKNDQ